MMSDRWRDELKKLRGVEPPENLWDRAQELPSADPLPPRRERIVAGVVAMSVFVAAGAFAFQALRPASRSIVGTIDPDPVVVARLFVAETGAYGDPSGSLAFGGETQEGLGTSYCWTFEGGGLCADTTSPDFADADFLQIPRGTPLRITGDATRVEGSVQEGVTYPFHVVKSLGAIEHDVALDFPPGRYVLELTGHWPQGERAFYFPIEIASTTAPVVTIDLTKDDTGASGVLSFEELQQEGLPGDAILSEDGSPGFVWDGSLAVTDFVQVPSGAVLEYSGNAPKATATFLVWPPSSDGGAQVVVEGDLDLPADPGRYTLGVLGSWSDGEPFVFIFGIEIVENSATPSPGGASLVPNVARVVCDENGTQVLTPVVAAQSDGLHLVFENPSGAKAYDLHPVTSERGTSVGGALAPSGETTSRGFSLEPGEVQVACLPTMNDSYLEYPTALLTIEDPDGLWIPTDPICTGATVESSGVMGDVYGLPDDEVESAIREALVGLVEGDEVLKPGYPETEFKVINLVVQRDGVVVAHVWLAGGLHVEACEGSGIAAAPTPDSVLDCAAPDRMVFEHTGGVDEPAGEAYIRVNTVGVLPSDALTHTGPESGPTGDDGIWTVTRNGSVIAWVDYPDLNGVACAGSGVGGVAGS